MSFKLMNSNYPPRNVCISRCSFILCSSGVSLPLILCWYSSTKYVQHTSFFKLCLSYYPLNYASFLILFFFNILYTQFNILNLTYYLSYFVLPTIFSHPVLQILFKHYVSKSHILLHLVCPVLHSSYSFQCIISLTAQTLSLILSHIPCPSYCLTYLAINPSVPHTASHTLFLILSFIKHPTYFQILILHSSLYIPHTNLRIIPHTPHLSHYCPHTISFNYAFLMLILSYVAPVSSN